MSRRQHAISFGLPVFVDGIVPFVLLWNEKGSEYLTWFSPFHTVLGLLLGISLFVCGLVLLTATIRDFSRIGQGTLAPWSPPSNLVVVGPYRYCRNPMISGVVLILLGEAFLFSSAFVLIWAIAAFVTNHFYFVFSEEPGLVARFGDEYLSYKEHVPRWIPRLRPWTPQSVPRPTEE
jgi:protein-S-isoprenylcysteine O-methyltransferase Ste14